MYWGFRGGATVNSVAVWDLGKGGIASASLSWIRLLLESKSLGGPKPIDGLGFSTGVPERELLERMARVW